MIKNSQGWAQFDTEIWTYRGEVGGVLFGLYTGQFKTPDGIPMVLTDGERTDLIAEKATYIENLEPGSPDKERADQLESEDFA